MYQDRVELYKKIEEMRDSKVVAYVTGDRPGMESQISTDVIDIFAEHLDLIFKQSKKISLIIYSRGGDVLAAWNIVNLIRMFCDEFEVIIPRKAQSSATLISIGANKIIMTKQATLGPIDPSIGSPYNPTIKSPFGQTTSLPVSVEDVAGFFELAANEMKKDADMSLAFQALVSHIHPLALGQVSRSRGQIKKLASKLLKLHMSDEGQIKKIIDFLCSESGSHDYTINRREAKNDLGLPVEKPNDALYNILKSLYCEFRDEMNLYEPFPPIPTDPDKKEIEYKVVRAVIESVEGGSDQFISKGTLVAQALQETGMGNLIPIQFLDYRQSEGWKHV